MDDQNAQVGWTEAQWNRVREEVLRAWQRVRVAGSFLPVYGPLPSSTQVVPSEVLNPDGTVDDQATAPLLEISLPVKLTRQQVREEDLSSALLQFRRRATQVGQLEDWYIFNGTYPGGGFQARPTLRGEGEIGRSSTLYLPSSSFLRDLSSEWPVLRGAPKPIALARTQVLGLLLRDPGALGLLEAARQQVEEVEVVQEQQEGARGQDQPGTRKELQVRERSMERQYLDNDGLMSATVKAMNTLEEHGYVAPYVCVYGRRPFQEAHKPVGDSIAFPRDRLEPLIGRELLHASAIDIPPRGSADEKRLAERWQKRGVLLSLADDAVDLAIAAEATPEFRQVDAQGRYVFSVFERFALRIKDPKAMVYLRFQERPEGESSSSEKAAPVPDEPTTSS
jgi:uncharacterized linocin/CFP29 family protein